ncbi:glycosyl transferase [Thioclava sp. F1Mire-8]|uniref:glycosyltransferase family 2 protein n=1 Tax=Thioclava sp. F1Mire-8 TaxID=1973006 RepID=UPI000B53BFCF|nr:glycosyltransferase family 2 protein [Thioclava sp. F1Mire-8]OWX99681.1 glycosyl transferase [Thioclava sp. F1Mire-8]
MLKLTAIILTFNEERHIARAINSLHGIADKVLVVDSESTDRTRQIAEDLGATILCHPFVTQAKQFNWALSQLPSDTDWVFRLDADEIVSPSLREQIVQLLSAPHHDFKGFTVNRRMTFLGRIIRHGGVFPVKVLRIFRYGYGTCEDRWMDEHIVVSGNVHNLTGEILDDNLNSLSWWTQKHNTYSSREVVDLVHSKFGLKSEEKLSLGRGQAGIKRWLKEKIYLNFPIGFRAAIYFFYRYLFRLGFLDGFEGLAFHFLQGFWYRFLVDAKMTEVCKKIETCRCSPSDAIEDILGIDVSERGASN